MQKNIQELINELKDLKKGVHTNSAKWAGLPVNEAAIDAAIAVLEAKGSAIESAKALVSQTQLDGRTAVEQYIVLASQTTTLAEGIHITEPGKFADYNLPVSSGKKAKDIPAKAVLESLTDDSDGVGFVIKCQVLDQIDGFEIEKSDPVDSTLLVLAPPYTHLRNTAKLMYIDDDVLKGKRYFYRIRGFNRRGYSEWSEPVSRVQYNYVRGTMW